MDQIHRTMQLIAGAQGTFQLLFQMSKSSVPFGKPFLKMGLSKADFNMILESAVKRKKEPVTDPTEHTQLLQKPTCALKL